MKHLIVVVGIAAAVVTAACGGSGNVGITLMNDSQGVKAGENTFEVMVMRGGQEIGSRKLTVIAK